MKITIYELLGLIKDDKAPKKIRCFGRDYEYSTNDEGIDYIEIDKEAGERYLTDVIGENYLSSIFSTTVEIIEEEKEIEEINLRYVVCKSDFVDLHIVDLLNNFFKENDNKINELVREVNKLKKEGK